MTEFAWYLQCYFPTPPSSCTQFQGYYRRLEDVNSGLFTYPMLMAADILLYDAEKVPVGKDQMQHLEMTRDVAKRFNNSMGETFVLPDVLVQESTMYVPGTNGGKMSKSQGNIINVLDDPKAIKKVINKEIVTDAPLEDPKDPDSSVVYQLYQLVASEEKVDEMAHCFAQEGMLYTLKGSFRSFNR